MKFKNRFKQNRIGKKTFAFTLCSVSFLSMNTFAETATLDNNAIVNLYEQNNSNYQVVQTGSANDVTIQGLFGASSNVNATQAGSNNFAYIQQSQNINSNIDVNQNGWNNTLDVKLTHLENSDFAINQNGNSNWAEVEIINSKGSASFDLNLTQNGNSNYAEIIQTNITGEMNIIQNNDGNKLYLVDKTTNGKTGYDITQNGGETHTIVNAISAARITIN